jgi:flagellar protein FlgJ
MNNYISRNTPIPLPSAQGAEADAIAPGSNSGANSAETAYRDKATKAAIQFEGFFISQMLHQMRSGTQEMAGDESVFNDPVNKDMLDMADTMVADKMAGQRAFGIADAILRQLLPADTASAAHAGNVTATAAAAAANGSAAATPDVDEKIPQKNNLVVKQKNA